MTIAKLRAARQLWARVAEVVGEPDAGAATVHAVTSLPMMAQRDPWVNMLRTTLAAFSRGRRRRGHRAGAPVRRRHPRRLARYRSEFRAADRPQHPTAAAGGIAHRPGARPGRRVVVRRGPHPAAGRAGVEALPGHRVPRRLRRRRATTSPPRSPRWRDAPQPTTSPTGAPRSPASTSTRTSPNRRCRRRDSAAGGGAVRRRVRGAAGPVGRLSRGRPARGRRCCCCRSARSPSTTSAPRSPRTCWRPAASRRSIPERRCGRSRRAVASGHPSPR